MRPTRSDSLIGAPGRRAAAHLAPGRLDFGPIQPQRLPGGLCLCPQVTPGTCGFQSRGPAGSAPLGHWEPEHRGGYSEGGRWASRSLAVEPLPAAVPGERGPPSHRPLRRSASHFPSGTSRQDLWANKRAGALSRAKGQDLSSSPT